MAIETPSGVTDEAAFPGRQARRAFAHLALSAQRPVSVDALADAVWGEQLPKSWDGSLKSLISKLRTTLVEAGLGGEPIVAISGCYQLRLPVDTWIDLEACARAVDMAEAAIRRRELDAAWSEATVATAIARRPFLPGEDADWIVVVRERLRSLHVRALDTLGDVWLARENPSLAVAVASEAIALEPFHEASYRVLMRGHVLAGNRAEAIRTYNHCVALLADELGVGPDPTTVALGEAIAAAPSTQPRAGTITIAVTDIVDSTRLASELGDHRWNALLRRHDELVTGCARAYGGQVVKHLGDGLLMTFASTGDALDAIGEALVRLDALDVDGNRIRIRVGIHAGEPITHDDDVFGLQVNIAARLNALARADEVLVSSVVRDLCPPGRFQFSEQRSEQLKGIGEPVTVFRADVGE